MVNLLCISKTISMIFFFWKGDLDKVGNIKVSSDCEESCLLGIDCNDKTSIGLVLPVLADTSIRLDGDG